MASLTTRRLTPALGIEIRGVDLNTMLTDTVFDEIYRVLMDGQVVFLPQQKLTPEAHIRLAKSFGELSGPHHVYPSVEGAPDVVMLENGGDTEGTADTDVWHTDLTFKTNPPFASILHSQVVPEVGGDTLWASMSAAYDALPGDVKKLLEGVKAVHDMGSFRNQYIAEGGEALLNEQMASVGQAVHDVVQTHPVTGVKFLYVNRGFTFHILDQSTSDGQRLLGYLLDHIEQPDFQVRHRWEPDTVAIWDNRITQHYAVNDYLPAYRRMHRITVIDDRRAPV